MSGAFSIVNVERSSRLHALVQEVVDRAAKTSPPGAGFLLSSRPNEFRPKLARSRLMANCSTALLQAEKFAKGVTEGMGGDKFQRFMAQNAEWSDLVHRLKTHAAMDASLSEFEAMFKTKFGIDFTGLLLPVHSPLEGQAVLLFSWLEDDLAPSSDRIEVVYLACLVRLVAPATVLADIRQELAADDPAKQPALCELIPRHWLLVEKPSSSVRLADEMAIPHDRVAAFGLAARFHWITYAVIDGAVFSKIDADMDAIEKERNAAKKKKKKARRGKRKNQGAKNANDADDDDET